MYNILYFLYFTTYVQECWDNNSPNPDWEILFEVNLNFELECGLRIGESSSICPFLTKMKRRPRRGRVPLFFEEWTDTRTFSDLKYTATKI